MNCKSVKLQIFEDETVLVYIFMYLLCMLIRSTWTQEMINNRNKSAVSMVQWVKDGSKICIVYADGNVTIFSASK